MITIEDSPIDLCRKKITVGKIIGVYGMNYPISYWYVYGFNEENVTLIGLDNNFNLFLENPKIVQTDTSSFQYFEVNYADTIYIPQNYIQHYYQNRYIQKRPKFGDVVFLETQFNTQKPFIIINYDPLSNVHLASSLCYDLYQRWVKTVDLNLSFCKYFVVSTKELRRDIFNKSREIRNNLERRDYEQLNILDQIIEFTAQMSYLCEKTDFSNIKLRELDFLDNLEEIPEEIEKIEYSEDEIEPLFEQYENNPLDYLYNYESSLEMGDCVSEESADPEPNRAEYIEIVEPLFNNNYLEDLEFGVPFYYNSQSEINNNLSHYNWGSINEDEPNWDNSLEMPDLENQLNVLQSVSFYDPWTTKQVVDIEDIVELNKKNTDEEYLNKLVNSLKSNEPLIVEYSPDDMGDYNSVSNTEFYPSYISNDDLDDSMSHDSFCPEDWYNKKFHFEEENIHVSFELEDESYDSSSSLEDRECIINTSSDDECQSEIILYDREISCNSISKSDEADESIQNEIVEPIFKTLEVEKEYSEPLEAKTDELDKDYDEIAQDEIEPFMEKSGCSIM